MNIPVIMEILRSLHRNKCTTAPNIAQRLNVSTRTIYRYMDELSRSGIPIIAIRGANGGFALMDCPPPSTAL